MKIQLTSWLFLSLFCTIIHLRAQDLIIKNDKTELSVQVQEITDDMVKYKPFNRQGGPLYSLRKTEIFVIIYQDGSRETFRQAQPVVGTTAYREQPRNSPPLALPVAERETASITANLPTIKSNGGYWGLSYMTPAEAFGELHGYTTEYGHYWLFGQRKTVGLLLDGAFMDFFSRDSPTYASIMLNAFFRPSASSKIYLGSGTGYAQVGVPVFDKYGNSKKTYFSDVGAKAFIGIGSFRATMMWPTLEPEGGGLLTFGFYTNPFK
ncbi:hypothetical protein [Fibrella aquatilis]|uniref:Uncharacterized protein n=1 Tax=Fibrella aquatilis TaxID=2817059 RepID=A0A939G4Z5_9BACT|nr:hypothetical protein [Fibrella aquatilis]MBO0930525.1 hypothetical protein [Fibrella aquatilis]